VTVRSAHEALQPTAESIAVALQQLGVRRGDTVMTYCDLRKFGFGRDGGGRLQLALAPDVLYAALKQVLGENGTLAVPAFSYSWTRGQVYSPRTSPSFEGSFSEYVRTRPGAKRSLHPLISVAAEGPDAEGMTGCRGYSSYGPESPFGWMHRNNVKHLAIGEPVCAFADYVQWACRVPYRYVKRFRGRIEIDGQRRERECEHCVRYLDQGLEAVPMFEALEKDSTSCVRKADLHGVPLWLAPSEDLFEALRTKLTRDPYALSTRPRDEEAVTALARLAGYGDGTLSFTAVNWQGREHWLWTIPGGLIQIEAAMADSAGRTAADFEAGDVEVYADLANLRLAGEQLSGRDLAKHLVHDSCEVTAARVSESSWLLRCLGPVPQLVADASYHVRLSIQPVRSEAVGRRVADKSTIVVIPRLMQDGSGASQAIRILREQLADRVTMNQHEATADFVERLFRQGVVIAVSRSVPERGYAPPIFQPDLAGAR
jgi:aminoglycoside 3-N-acetyltransferase